MSRDGFISESLRRVNRKYRTPETLTWIAGLIVLIGTLFMDINISASMCNFGTLASFVIVCIAILILRKTDPDRPRPFRVPFSPWFPLLGILTCSGLAFYSFWKLKTSAIYFSVWLIVGLVIYIIYATKHKETFSIKN